MQYSRHAYLASGFSESKDFTGPFMEALTSGPNRLFSDIELALLGDVLDDSDGFNKKVKDATVVTTSAGIISVKNAALVVAINGVEPTPIWRQTLGVAYTLHDPTELEPGIVIDGLMTPLKELRRHPMHNLSVPRRVRRFSTVQHLIDNRDAFPQGRVIMAGSFDQFHFTRPDKLARAEQDGIQVVRFEGGHTFAYQRPNETAGMIKDAFNAMNLG